MPALVREANSLKESNTISLKKIVRDFDNRDNLRESLKIIKRGI
jgi:phosphopantothenate synthetase